MMIGGKDKQSTFELILTAKVSKSN